MHAPVSESHRQRWWGLVAVSTLVIVAAASWVAGQHVQSADQAASRAAPPEPSWITARVEQRVLSQTVISRGDIRPQVSIELGAPSSVEGEAIITNIGAHVGDQAVEGARLIEVSGRPVFVMAGAVPVYRTLKPGMSGADVTQLQEALARLGYTPDSNGTFGQATKDAVTAFYAAAGYTPQLTSDTVDADIATAQQQLAQAQTVLDDAEATLTQLTAGGPSPTLVAAQNELAAARRAVADVTAASNTAVALAQQQVAVAVAASDRLNNDPGASQTDRDQAGLAVSQANAALDEARRDRASQIAAANDRVGLAEASLSAAKAGSDPASATRARDNALAARDSATAALWTLIATTGPTVAQGEIVFVPTLPARVQSAVSALGPVAGGETTGVATATYSSSALVTLAGGSLVVSASARSAEVDLVRVGMPVELLDEQTNTVYPASIADIAASPETGADGQIGYPMTLVPQDPFPPELASINVRVTITAASTETEALVVPVAALSSGADGSARVSVLRGDATEPIDVDVTAGLSADGFVAVTPVEAASLGVDDRVVVGR